MLITVASRTAMSCAMPITPRLIHRRSQMLPVDVLSDIRFTLLPL
jgi:hypothetical protein